MVNEFNEKNVLLYFFSSLSSCFCQGLDEEALVDHGKTSFTTHTNYEKEDLESKFKATGLNNLSGECVFMFLF